MELLEKISLLKSEIQSSEEQLFTLKGFLSEEQFKVISNTMQLGINSKRVELEKLMKSKSVIIEDLLSKLVSELNLVVNKELLNDINNVATNVACLLEINNSELTLRAKSINKTTAYENGEYNVIYNNNVVDVATVLNGKITLKSGINSLSMLQTMLEIKNLQRKEFIAISKERFNSILNAVNFSNEKFINLHNLDITNNPYIVCKYDDDKFIRRNGNNKLTLQRIEQETTTEEEQTEQ